MADWFTSDPPLIALDTETSGLHPDDGAKVFAVSFTWLDDAGVLQSAALNFAANHDAPRLFEPEPCTLADWVKFIDWVQCREIVMHNAPFDIAMLRDGAPFDWPGVNLTEQVVFDTMLANWVVDPLYKRGLKPTAARLWGEDEAAEQAALKPYLGKAAKFSSVPWSVMEPYALKDAELTYRLYEHRLDQVVSDENLSMIYEREHALMKVVVEMERVGISFDADTALDVGKALRKEMLTLQTGLPFTPTPVKAAKYFTVTKGLPRHCETDGGAASAKECCVESWKHRGGKVAEDYAKFNSIKGALGRWYEPWPELVGDDGKLRPVIRQAGAKSGRFSMSRVNLMAIPQDYRLGHILPHPTPRSLLVPEPGMALVEVDISQAELRLGAHFTKCTPLLEAFAAGDDPHAVTAHNLFGVTLASLPKDDAKRYRVMAKAANFGLAYGMGAETFSHQLELAGVPTPLERVQSMVDLWRGSYPHYPRTWSKMEAHVHQERHIELLGGKKSWFELGTEHTAFNRAVQGGVAELMKTSMIRCQPHLPEWGARLVLQIHDALVFELPAENAEDFQEWFVNWWGPFLTKRAGVLMEVEAESFGGQSGVRP